MKSGDMAARAIARHIAQPASATLRADYDKPYWKSYRITYSFLAFLQRISYNNDVQREVFARMRDDPDVQRLTFDGYLTKHIEPAPGNVQMRMTKNWIATAAREIVAGRR